MRLVPRSRSELSLGLLLLILAVAVSGGLRSMVDAAMASDEARPSPRHHQDRPLAALFVKALRAAEAHRAIHGRLPREASELVGPSDRRGHRYFSLIPRDPWGHKLQLWATGDPERPLVFYSRGADGLPGGLGEDADVDSSQVLRGGLLSLHDILRENRD